MIPKTIHYCWFGGKDKPKLFKKCYKSWKKYCPDYEIIEWNEDNFDLNCCDYVREAYEAKKWAFVSDYVRIWALHNYGGVYLDTDVELTNNLDDFLTNSAFTGFDAPELPFTAVFGCEKEHRITGRILESYSDRKFKIGENVYDLQTNTESVTKLFIKEYAVKLNNETQSFEDGLTIYSNDYFCPKNFTDGSLNVTVNTCAIHWFSSSWHTREERIEHITKMIKIKIIRIVDCIFPDVVIKKILGDYLYDIFKYKAGKK